MRIRTGMFIAIGVVGTIALANKPALASTSGCAFLEQGVCSSTPFEICFPAGPWGPAYCSTSVIEVYGRTYDE